MEKRVPVKHAMAKAFKEVGTHLDLGIKNIENKTTKLATEPKAVNTVQLHGISYIDIPVISKRIMSGKNGKKLILTSIREQGLIAATPTMRKRVFAAEKMNKNDFETVKQQVLAGVTQQHTKANKDKRVFNIELQDHYVGLDLGESNPTDLVHALHANGLNANKGVEQKTVLFDDANFLGDNLLPEQVITEHDMLKNFIDEHINPQEYKLVSESKLKKVFDSLNELANIKKKGKCPDYDSLLYITKLGKKKEFADKFAKKHGLKKKEVMNILSILPEFKATDAFVSLPKTEEVGNRVINAKSQQQSTAKRLTEHGLNKLNNNIYLHLYDVNRLKNIELKHFETMMNPKQRKKTEVKDAHINILTWGQRGLKDVKTLSTNAKQVIKTKPKHSEEADDSFVLHHLIRMEEAYPKVIEQARNEMDIELLPQYMHELMTIHEKARSELSTKARKDSRYKTAVVLADEIVKDILKWANVKK